VLVPQVLQVHSLLSGRGTWGRQGNGCGARACWCRCCCSGYLCSRCYRCLCYFWGGCSCSSWTWAAGPRCYSFSWACFAGHFAVQIRRLSSSRNPGKLANYVAGHPLPQVACQITIPFIEHIFTAAVNSQSVHFTIRSLNTLFTLLTDHDPFIKHIVHAAFSFS